MWGAVFILHTEKKYSKACRIRQLGEWKDLLMQSPPDQPGRHSAQYLPLVKKSSLGPHVPLLQRLQFSKILQPESQKPKSQTYTLRIQRHTSPSDVSFGSTLLNSLCSSFTKIKCTNILLLPQIEMWMKWFPGRMDFYLTLLCPQGGDLSTVWVLTAVGCGCTHMDLWSFAEVVQTWTWVK